MEDKQVNVEGLADGLEEGESGNPAGGDSSADLYRQAQLEADSTDPEREAPETIEQAFTRILEAHEYAIMGLGAEVAELRGRLDYLLELANGRG